MAGDRHGKHNTTTISFRVNSYEKATIESEWNEKTGLYRPVMHLQSAQQRFFSFLPLGRCFFFRYMIRGIFEDSIKI